MNIYLFNCETEFFSLIWFRDTYSVRFASGCKIPYSNFTARHFPAAAFRKVKASFTNPRISLFINSVFPLHPPILNRKEFTQKLNEGQGIQCLEDSNWTICSLLSQFCYDIFQTVDFHTPEPISIIPKENGKREFTQHRGD